MQILKKLLFILSINEKKKAGLLVIMILILSFLDMLGVASIMPFIAVLTNPSLVETNYFLKHIFQASSIFGVENSQEFMFFSGVLLFFILIFPAIILFISLGTWDTFVRMHIPDGDCWENAKHERVCKPTANCKIGRNFCD